jgi:hypothetical protein
VSSKCWNLRRVGVELHRHEREQMRTSAHRHDRAQCQRRIRVSRAEQDCGLLCRSADLERQSVPTALHSDLNLRALLIRASEIGAAFSPHALPDPALAFIGAEIETGSFERLPEQTGPYGVREDAELLRIPPDDTMRYPTVVQLRADLTHLVHQHGGGLAGLDKWEANDIAAMRYRAGSFGITPHRDSKRYRGLIAIFTTEGSAPFTFCANREGDIIDKWTAAPGSLILMRGTGLNGAENRPFHAVAGPTTGSRVSLTFRMSDR